MYVSLIIGLLFIIARIKFNPQNKAATAWVSTYVGFSAHVNMSDQSLVTLSKKPYQRYGVIQTNFHHQNLNNRDFHWFVIEVNKLGVLVYSKTVGFLGYVKTCQIVTIGCVLMIPLGNQSQLPN